MSSKHHESHDPQSERRSEKPQEKYLEGEGAEGSAVAETALQGQSQAAPAGAESAPASREAELAARNEELAGELAAVRAELSSVNDKYLRKLADEVNFRKRMAREKEDTQRFAMSALIGDLIPILDDFDRAIASAETARDYAVLHDGIVLIRRQLGGMLESKYGLKRFESLGKPFDPNHHEAVAMIEGEGDEAMVAEEFLPGYGLHERILRTAKVKVMMPGRSRDEAADVAENDSGAADGDAVDASGAGEPPTNIER